VGLSHDTRKKEGLNDFEASVIPSGKKVQIATIIKKSMATIFWDSQGIILIDFLPRGETINAVRYCQTLNKLREAIRRKRPGRLTEGVILQHDNATPHTANITKDWLHKYGWEVLTHPPHSPDLAPSDYHLFMPLKRHLAGKRFDADEDLIQDVRTWLQNLDVNFCREGIYSLMHRWQKCIDRNGDYVEK
jgi:histone-lysine N-methyltransferase SETMAR